MALTKTEHSEYSLLLEYWIQVRTFTRGLKSVQAYLQDVTSDTSPVGVKRNKEYKARATYVNFTARTRNSLIGSIFRKPAIAELPSYVDYMIDNADGTGMSLELVAKLGCTNLLEVGRVGLLVNGSKAQAKITTYTAENCKDWKVDENGKLIRVELITGEKTEKHLVLDAQGLYIVELYEDAELQEVIEPRQFSGARFDFIPFIFAGSTDNTPACDDLPLWSIVDLSRAHYQNSADMEDVARYMLPTPFVTVTNKQWYDDIMGGKPYEFGNGAMIPVPEGGSAGLIQASPNQMHGEMMRHKEEQLVALGARLISGNGSGQAETAEATRLKFSAENSVLDGLVMNMSQAIEQCLEWAQLYMSRTVEDVEYMLNREFFDLTINPQQIAADILLLDRGIVAINDVRHNLRKQGYLADDRTDEILDDEVEINAGGL